MSPETLQARLDQFELQIEGLDDTFDKALAVYEYPFTDGAALEDLGMNARTVRFRCFFYEETYDTHKDLLAYLHENRICELRHPVYGLLKGRVRRIAVRHDDRIRTAEMDIEFVEQRQGAALTAVRSSVVAETEQAYRDGLVEIDRSIRSHAATRLGPAQAAAIMGQELTKGKNVLSQITGLISSPARQYLAGVDVALHTLDSIMQTASPPESILRTIEFNLTLPGRITSAVAHCVERYSLSIETVAVSPIEYAAQMVSAVAGLRAAVPDFGAIIARAGTLHGCLVLGRMYQQDEENRRTALALESAPAFSPEGDLLRIAELPSVAAVDDLERSLAVMREAIQTALTLDRSGRALQTAAQALLRHVNAVKLQRERIAVREVKGAMPLHAVCLRYGLPYASAPRILAINRGIANPTFVEGALQLYVR